MNKIINHIKSSPSYVLNKFVGYWDDFVKNWFDNHQAGVALLIPESQAFVNLPGTSGSNKFNPDELVEPYLGNPENCKFVIINYNPGGSQNSNNPSQGKESDKYYSNLSAPLPDGWLIKEFHNSCGDKYSSFVNNWSSLKSSLLKHNPPVCGVSWWQGANGKGGRMDWINRFAMHYGIKNVISDDVFALEMAPYHSKTKGNFMLARNLQQHYADHVLIPAGYAAMNTVIKMAICVGAQFNKVLKRIGADRLKLWDSTNTSQGYTWPQPTNYHKYALWRLKLPNDQYAYYLVLSHKSWTNNLPTAAFQVIEGVIANECKQLIP